MNEEVNEPYKVVFVQEGGVVPRTQAPKGDRAGGTQGAGASQRQPGTVAVSRQQCDRLYGGFEF